jgi:hypothetical protein
MRLDRGYTAPPGPLADVAGSDGRVLDAWQARAHGPDGPGCSQTTC